MAIDWGLGYRAPDDSVAAALQAFGTGRQLALQQQTQQRGENLRTAVRAAYNPATGALDPNAVQGAIADYGDPGELIHYHQQLDATQQAKHAQMVQAIGQAAQAADTPEKWDAAVNYLAANVDPALARYKGQFSPENRMAAISAAGQYEAWRKGQQPVVSHPGDIARDPTTGAVVYSNPENTKYIPTGDGRIAVISPDGNIGFQGGAAGGAAAGAPSSGASAAVVGGRLDPHAFFHDFVLPHEGGLNPHDANGSPTNFGINQAANPGVDVHRLTADGAANIFADKYFKASGAADLPPAMAAVVADTAYINPARAKQFLAESGGDPQKFMQLRAAWMNGLVQSDPDKYGPYAKAWANRNRDLSAYAQSIQGDSRGQPAQSSGPRVAFVGEARPEKAPTGFRWDASGKKLEPIPGGPADAAVLPPDVLRGMAEQYLAGDKSVFQNLGRGSQGATNIVRLRGEVARQMGESHMNGRDVAAKMAEFNGLVAGERAVGNRAANIEMASDEASRVIPLALQASEAFPRNGFTPLARAEQAISSGTNDPRLRRFVTANTALVNVYARAISPTGAVTVSDKEHARAMLDTAYDQPSYRAVVEQMQREIEAAKAAPGDVRASLRTAITGDTPTPDRSPVRTPNGPRVGEVRRGYTYLGGPPGNPASWRKN